MTPTLRASLRMTPADIEELGALLCSVADNLGDMPVSDEWAAKTSSRAISLLARNDYVRPPDVAPNQTPTPRAWLCELVQEDDSVKTMFVEQDPAGLRFGDVGEPSPFRVTKLYDHPAVGAAAVATPCAQVPVHPRFGRLWANVRPVGSEAPMPSYPLDDLFDQGAIGALQAEIDRLRDDRNCEKHIRKDAEAAREDLIVEVARLNGIAKIAAQFTLANDTGDDISDKLDGASPDEADALLLANELADDSYNRNKDALFIACRSMMGWPARRANYPTLGPMPSAQIGDSTL